MPTFLHSITRPSLLILALYAGWSLPAARAQELRVASAAANFTTNTLAVFASMSDVTKVYRLCATGGAIPAGTCAGAAAIGGRGAILDWVVIEGTMRNCGSTCSATNLGRNGGGFVRAYVTGGTGAVALQSASTTPSQLGFASLFGFDGVPGGGDDAGANGLGATGVPPGWPLSSATAPINLGTLNRAALVECATGLRAISDSLPVLVRPTWSVTPANELCIVEIDADGNGSINNLQLGAPLPRTTIAGSGNETTNYRTSSDIGVSPIPPQDYSDPTINTLTVNSPVTTGLQILKFVVNRNVRAKSDVNKKIMLQDPQIEAIFGGASFGNACSWADVGGQVVGEPDAKMTVIIRETNAALRQVVRNTFLLNPRGSQPEGAVAGTFGCENFDENGGGTTTIVPKQYLQVTTLAEQITAAGGSGLGAGTLGGITVVNASRTNTTTYSVPVFGVDPDAQGAPTLRLLVKCGMYPFTGPLTVGRGPGGDPLGLRQAFVNSISSELVYDDASSTAADYLPFGNFDSGVAYAKDLTAGQTFLKFKPASCPGVIPSAPLPPV
ncbi:MAG: hypothetical protein U0900_17880 [Myxococcota bacterium]